MAAVVPFPCQPGAKVAVVQVIPTTSPQDARTSDLITRLRSDVIPAAEKGSGLQVLVGGGHGDLRRLRRRHHLQAAALHRRHRRSRLPAPVHRLPQPGGPRYGGRHEPARRRRRFGVVVAFFQWGWGSDRLGLGRAGPVEAFLPVIMLAVLFGLSMDYQVFLVSRMHEEWVHTRDNRRAVITGQATTGRVITAAAAIMICVFAAFVFGGQRVIAEFGIGLAAAVLLDAFVLRTLLVPSLMHLFGRANWWLPRPVDRRLPHLAVEPPEDADDAEDASA